MKIELSELDSPKGNISIYKITNNSGAWVELSSLGAGITSICVPDKDGDIADVVLGYSNYLDYLYDSPCAGKTVGRYANRIANGIFTLNGKQYKLNTNCGPNSLHGGPEGFQNQNWQSKIHEDCIVFTYTSKNGEENFPGNVTASVTYKWDNNNTLTIDFEACSDTDTIINLTNHTYFNLKGVGNGDVLNHTLKLNSSYYLPTDSTLVPTGEYAPVANTPMDFTQEKALGIDVHSDFEAIKFGKGYDHCWLINDFQNNTLKEVCTLSEPISKRELSISSTQVGVQVYTGNWLNDSPIGKHNQKHFDYCAVAIECQGLPDAPNKPQFPSQILKEGDKYKQTIVYSFKVVTD